MLSTRQHLHHMAGTYPSRAEVSWQAILDAPEVGQLQELGAAQALLWARMQACLRMVCVLAFYLWSTCMTMVAASLYPVPLLALGSHPALGMAGICAPN